VVAYDIPDDKRRTKLHAELKNFGRPVQYSVFECILNRKEFEKMRKAVLRIIDKRKDKVRYYPLDNEAVKKILTDGRGKVTADPDVIVV
ncbi:MAG: CRISPR-associated endonuclease Cas2, partial [Nitrospirota bacterium]